VGERIKGILNFILYQSATLSMDKSVGNVLTNGFTNYRRLCCMLLLMDILFSSVTSITISVSKFVNKLSLQADYFLSINIYR